MRKYDVRTLSDAFLYILDCQLATVCDMAMKKSRGKHEYERQINIAQTMIDWAKEFQVSFNDGDRAEKVCSHNWSVAEWAKTHEPTKI